MLTIKPRHSHFISVAPMMACTDRHDRYFLRLISPNARLYTEMLTMRALIHGDRKRLLQFHPIESPLTLQVGGNDPHLLAECARIGESFGYDEINLNIGCPSARVKSGQFGACLMLQPNLVADCIFAMQKCVQVPITVKCRIGVDENESYEFLHHFIQTVASAGCLTFIIHARKALLSGLSPKENRMVPPLKYTVVKELKKDFPRPIFILNGGIKSLSEVSTCLTYADGVMIGRTAYANPYFLAEIEACYYPSQALLTRKQIVEAYALYVQEQLAKGVRLTNMTRHLFGLFHNQRGGRAWRRYLSEYAGKKDANASVLLEAFSLIG